MIKPWILRAQEVVVQKIIRIDVLTTTDLGYFIVEVEASCLRPTPSLHPSILRLWASQHSQALMMMSQSNLDPSWNTHSHSCDRIAKYVDILGLQNYSMTIITIFLDLTDPGKARQKLLENWALSSQEFCMANTWLFWSVLTTSFSGSRTLFAQSVNSCHETLKLKAIETFDLSWLTWLWAHLSVARPWYPAMKPRSDTCHADDSGDWKVIQLLKKPSLTLLRRVSSWGLLIVGLGCSLCRWVTDNMPDHPPAPDTGIMSGWLTLCDCVASVALQPNLKPPVSWPEK